MAVVGLERLFYALGAPPHIVVGPNRKCIDPTTMCVEEGPGAPRGDVPRPLNITRWVVIAKYIVYASL